MKKLILLSLLLFAFCSRAQTWGWAHQSNGGTGNGIQSAGDGKGNLYVALDAFTGSINYGPQTFTAEVVLAKHDAAGVLLWEYPLNAVRVYAVSADTSGNVYVSGETWNGAILHSAANTDTLTSKGGFDCFIAKYSATGNLLWAKTFGDTISDDNYTTLKTDAVGNSYVSGFGSYYSGQTIARYYVSKYDPNGNLLWNITSPWYNDAEPSVADLDKEGNYYITGTFYNTVIFGSTTLNVIGSYNMFVVKYDKNGNILWAKRDGGNGTEGQGISVDNKGHFYITGMFLSPSTFGSTTLNSSSSAYPGAMFIVKYDTSGTMLWAKSEGVIQGSVACDSTGFFIGGFFSSPPANSSAPATGTLGLAPNQVFLNSPKSGEFFVAKYNDNGNLRWAIQPGGSGGQYDAPSNIYSDKKGSCYITGHFEGNTIAGSTTLSSPYNSIYYDAFLIKVKDSLSVSTAVKNLLLQSKGFSVFPNPTGGSVNVQYATSEECSSLDLYVNDVLGQRLYTKNCKGSRELNETIDLSHYPKGVYFVELLTPEKREVKKIIVE